MIKMIVKYPEKEPKVEVLNTTDQFEEILEGEFEIVEDDLLPGIYILINDEARGIKPHNFTIQTEGTHDWVYGTSLFINMEEEQIVSLTEQQIQDIEDYFSRTRAYK